MFIFFLLSSRRIIKNFLLSLFKTQKEIIKNVIENTQLVLRQYMSGLLIEMVIISITNTALFLIIGIPYAIFLGILRQS